MKSVARQPRGRVLSWLGLGAATAIVLAACSPGGFNPMPGGFGNPQVDGQGLPLAAGQTFGKGPVRVALLLPLTGDPGLATVGISMANASQLAVDASDLEVRLWVDAEARLAVDGIELEAVQGDPILAGDPPPESPA